MNKSELVEEIAEGAGISKASAARALDSFIGTVTEELASGGEVALVGLGTY
ncbi:MAG: DNA-binding protein HU-beta [Alteromonadaceae bacterium]|jgi:DNA-binding protein HU-beta